MNEPLVLVTRLDELADIALTDNSYERAAIYAAVNAILSKFKDSKINTDQQIMEVLRSACFYICAAIGYEFIINKTPEQCIAKARSELRELRNAINFRYY
jgi:hypothetical protein